jgi:ribosomal-protein-serine acetyltransferase
MLSYSFAPGAEVRLLDHHHAEELFDLIDQNRTYLRRWLPEWDLQKSVNECKAMIKSSLEQLAANDGFLLGIWSDGHLAGVVGSGRADWENRSIMLGYWLGESYQGKGLVTGACRAVIDYLFRELKLHRVEIRCATDNPRSCGVPRRLGFTKEGLLRQAQALDDRFVDIEVYGLLAVDRKRGNK